MSSTVHTKVCSPPTELGVNGDENTLTITWAQPAEIPTGYDVTGYTMKVARYPGDGDFKTAFFNEDKSSFTIDLNDDECTNDESNVLSLNSASSYVFTLYANCDDNIGEEIRYEQILPKHKFLAQSQMYSSPGNPIYLVNTSQRKEVGDITTITIGDSNKQAIQPRAEKTVLLIGQTGSGKTTWINAIFNYVLGVKYNDEFRFKLIADTMSEDQSQSQTSNITVYKIMNEPGMKMSSSLTLIDTPGFGDTGGMGKDKEIEQQMKDLLSRYVDHVNAIAFVAPSSSTRLTYTQRYVLDSFQKMFASDIKDNVFVLSTFADTEVAPLKSVIEQHLGFECRKFFPFNNSAFFDDIGLQNHSDSVASENSDFASEDFYNKTFWNLGNDNFEKFMHTLDITPAVSLTLTKEVLDERERIEVKVAALHLKIKEALATFDQLKTEQTFLRSCKDEEEALRKKRVVEVQKIVYKKIQIPDNQNTTTCLECNRTCHEKCVFKNDEDKKGCAAMDRGGNCRVCEKRCNWKLHRNLPYTLEAHQVTTTETVEELQARYQEKRGKICSIDEVITMLHKELRALGTQIKCTMSEISDSLRRLKEIAMLSDPRTQVEYIDAFIDAEREEKRPGWERRVNDLRKFRQEAEAIYKISEGSFDPFSKYREEAERAIKQGKGMGDLSFWNEIANAVDGHGNKAFFQS